MTKLLAIFSIFLLAPLVTAQKTNPPNSGASHVYAIREGYVDANGVLIYYKIFGRGKPLVIVAHLTSISCPT